MQPFAIELKDVISRRLAAAGSREVLAIASALCESDQPSAIEVAAMPTSARFEVDGDLVRDRSTGLIWSRKNACEDRKDWNDAKQVCKSLTLGGFNDWRLPTIRELLTLVDYERNEPAIDTDVFECQSSWYWTSTTLKANPGGFAWCVGFYDGLTDWSFQYYYGFVRAVRVGQF